MKGARRSSSSNRRLLASFLNACRKLGVAPTAGEWAQLHAGDDEAAIPVDVPRGHTVVYVGAELRRHVVRVSSLGHPLFRELLDDRAREEYAFAADDRLCLPCDEDIFLAVLCHVDSKHDYCRRLVLCS
jgi:SAUR family protein